jgi:hypothetical protein
VVLPFDRDACFFELEAHLIANVLQAVGWSDREVALFRANLVTEVRELFPPAVPVALSAVDQMEGGIARVAVADFVENKELGLRSEEGGVSDSGALEIRFRFFGDAARVAIVGLARDRIHDGADQAEGRFGVKDIDPRRARIGDDEHVAGVDRAPAADARSVEAEALGENLLAVLSKGGGEMLPGAWQIGELKVHEFDLVVFDHFADVRSGFVFFFGHGDRVRCVFG